VKVTLNNVRLAFPDLWEPRAFNGEGAAKFGASFLIPKDHPAVKVLEEAFEAVAKEKWAAKAGQVLKALKSADNICLHDGDAKADLAGYEGNYYISARTSTRPLVIDRDRSPLVQADGRPYGGCYVNAIVDVWPQDNGFGKRINASLAGVQFVKDGEAFAGGGAASPDDFAVVDGDDLV